MIKYKIRNYTEETFCDYCGWQLLVKDTVYYDTKTNKAYCSRGCMEESRLAQRGAKKGKESKHAHRK